MGNSAGWETRGTDPRRTVVLLCPFRRRCRYLRTHTGTVSKAPRHTKKPIYRRRASSVVLACFRSGRPRDRRASTTAPRIDKLRGLGWGRSEERRHGAFGLAECPWRPELSCRGLSILMSTGPGEGSAPERSPQPSPCSDQRLGEASTHNLDHCGLYGASRECLVGC